MLPARIREPFGGGSRGGQAAIREALSDLADQPVSTLRDSASLKVIDFQTLERAINPVGTDRKALITGGETGLVEFKETVRYNLVALPGTGGKGKPAEFRPGADPNLEREVWKAVGGFLNSSHGGTLLLGVRDDKSIRGLDDDYSVTKPSRKGKPFAQMGITKVSSDKVT